MSFQNLIISQPKPSPPKGIVYGPPKVGKSTFAGHGASSLLIDCENGAGAIACKRTPYLSDWPTMLAWLQFVEREEHSFSRISIDTIDWMLRRMVEHVSGATDRRESVLGKSHGGYGSGKEVLRNYIYLELLPVLDRIINRGIAVVLLAHAKRVDITDIDGVTTEMTVPDILDDVLNIFVEWSDFVCLARREPDGTRLLVADQTPNCLAGNRYSLPPVLPFEWPGFAGAIHQALNAKFAKPAEAPAPEQAQPQGA